MNNQLRIAFALMLAVFGSTKGESIFPMLGLAPVLSEPFKSLGLDLTGADQELISLPLPGVPRARPERLEPCFRVQPLSFERNDGQCDSEVKFLARGPGYHLFLTQTQAVMVFSETRTRNGEREWGAEGSSAPNAASSQNASRGAQDFTNGSAYLDGVDSPTPDPVGGTPTRATETVALPFTCVLRMRLFGASSSPPIRGDEQLPGKINYFIGNDSARWRTNIATYARVRLEEVYPGIDLVYYGNQREMEYDFIVAPSADPNVIKLAFEGVDKIEVDRDGELVLHVSSRQVRWHRPRVYQEINGVRHEIAAAYRLNSPVENPLSGELPQVAFQVAAYDPTQQLVIDPALVYGTFLGGSDSGSNGYGIAVDPDGNTYIAGQTASARFPTNNPLQGKLAGQMDAFITKLDSTGQIFYSTYIGGTGNDYGSRNCLAVDSAGNAYVVGSTSSRNFPVANALQANFGGGTSDAFVLKLSPGGSALVYSTYLGGSREDSARGLAVDSLGNAYVFGNTASTNFPVANPTQPQYAGGPADAFVTKLNPTGTALVYSTFLGGSDYDFAETIAIGDQGNVYISGYTKSRDFPTQSAFQSEYGGGTWDGFLAKLSPAGDALLFSSYFGGTSYDYVQAMAVGRDGDIYFSGLTGSDDLLTVNAIQPQKSASGGLDGILAINAFVARYDPGSNSLMFSTYLGGSVSDEARRLALDAAGNVYVGGQTASPDFPTTADAYQANYAGGGGTLGLGHDAFLSVLSADGSKLIYSSFLGGSWEDVINGVALDRDGNVYLIGDAGSEDFPVQSPILPNPVPGPEGPSEVFVAKFSPIVELPPFIRITRLGNTVTIIWPASAGFQLESATDLSANNVWSVVTDPILAMGDQNTVTVDTASRLKFYRLKKQ